MLEKRVSNDGSLDWGPDYRHIHSQTLEKLASDCYTPDSLVEEMGKLRPRPEGRYILLNALGAYEYWGFNKNGDAFPEWSLRGDEPPQSVKDILEHKVKAKLPNFSVPYGRYGYKTFVTDAHVYVQHQNTDPTKSIGDVIASAYNDKMHRVELIVFVYRDRNPELVDKIDNGEPVPFSMGARMAFDVSGCCLNVARTRAEYCDHVKFNLRGAMADGRPIYLYNFFPKFFDISYVRTPADKTAWQLKKVAQVMSAPVRLPVARDLPKLAEIIKREEKQATNLGSTPINPELLNFIISKAKSKYESCPDDPRLLEAVRGHKISEVLASLSGLGILLRPAEVTKLSSGSPTGLPEQFQLSDINDGLVRKLEKVAKTRSFFDPHFTKQASVGTQQARPLMGTDTNSFKSYVSYLQTIDLEKLAEWVETSPVALSSLNPDKYLLKFAGLSDTRRELPSWLPFFASILSFNTINK